MEERKRSSWRGDPTRATSSRKMAKMPDNVDRVESMDLSFGDMVTTKIVMDLVDRNMNNCTWSLDMGTWRRKGSLERKAVLAQGGLPPPAGHTLHWPSVLAKRKVPFQADSGDFPGVRASDPLAYDASM